MPENEESQSAGSLSMEDLVAPADIAIEAGLRYIEDGQPGYTRRRCGRGFCYFDAEGNLVKDAELRKRFEALVIPPAWREVWICPEPQGHIQATGRDARNRKQYIYHPDWDLQRNQTKFDRMLAFARLLPPLRARLEEDLRRPTLTRAKVVAVVISLMESTLVRIGNPEYARTNQSYGLTTLLDQHVAVNGSQVSFVFTGKHGKPHAIELKDRRMAGIIRRCQELPGQHLFQYIDENGVCCQAITSGDVNTYLRVVTGQDFSAKDFRTWGGTVVAAQELDAAGPAESEKEAAKQVVQMVKTVSHVLGNTPAICRKYYIHPAVLAGYVSGELFAAMEAGRQPPENEDQAALSEAERGVLFLLSRAERPVVQSDS